LDDQLVRRSVGSKIKQAFEKAGSAIKKGFQKVGAGIKSVAEKVKTGVVTAAKKVGTFMKTTGAKVAKFGLKVVESVGEAVGHVASFIPEIGKPIQQAIHGISKVAGVISDHIHAKLSDKLQKGMNVMNKADQVMSYMPRRRDLSEEEEAFQQRDISEAYYLEERDDIALEN
jgi:phage-related protein